MASPSAPAPLSPLWWLLKLEKELSARQVDMCRMNDWYTGNHPLPFLTKSHSSKMQDEWARLLADCQSNFMELVVDAVEERLKVEGFRVSAKTDPVTDGPSWEIWQANQMDANSQAAFVEALVKGVSYLSVWAGDKRPTIAVEDPTETIVGYKPGSNFRERAAAVKIWDDDWTGNRLAYVYLPDGIYKFEAKADTSGNPQGSTPDEPKWKPLDGDVDWTGKAFAANPTGVVPIIPLRNKPRLLVEGRSEIENVYRSQSRINGLLFLMMLAGYMGAHKQRWAVGLKIMEDANGKPVEPFAAGVDRVWQTENPEAKFGEFDQTTLDGYIAAVEQAVRHIAVQSRMPRHYLEQTGQSPSGDAIESAESGLVMKVERKQRDFGEGLEEAIGLARKFAGEKDTDTAVDSELVWASAETETIATLTDAVLKQFAGGLIPREAAQEKLGYTQTQIIRFKAMLAQEDLMREAALPAADEPALVE